MRDVLVVDLDGTLIKSDMLFECFWSALSRDWRTPLHAAVALRRGRAAIKRVLACAARVDVASLPYDTAVIEYVKAWRAGGGRTALVTATDDAVAQAIGAHLGFFDEVHGSTGGENLKGERKAAFLVARYGTQEFSYMGNARADLPVWARANRAIVVRGSGALARQAGQVAPEMERLGAHSVRLRAYAEAMRPHQWLKNVLVFLPMLAAHRMDEPHFVPSILAFAAFSLIASSVYVLNDLLDLNADRAHPRKRARPFAAGRIPIAAGTWMAAGLLGAGALLAALLGTTFFSVMAGYFALTMCYSLYLKRQVILDINVLALLYSLRIVAGAVATEIALSAWLLAFSSFFFLSLAAVKRQAELVDNIKQGRAAPAGRGYHVDDLPIISMISISAGYMAVLVMALYVNSPAVAELYGVPQSLWGVCGVLLYWTTRTVMCAHRGEMHDDPMVYAATDRTSQTCFALIVVFVLAGTTL